MAQKLTRLIELMTITKEYIYREATVEYTESCSWPPVAWIDKVNGTAHEYPAITGRILGFSSPLR